MADLSAYVSYSTVLDNTGSSPVITITDTTSYPGGDNTVTSYAVTILQPDGITVSTNLFVGGDIVQKSVELRLANDGNFQNGTYIVNAVVIADYYDDTNKNYLFKLSYIKPIANILPKIDVFTPNIKVYDATIYTPLGLTLNNITRAYSGIIHSVSGTDETITGAAQILDLVYGGHYYDAQYIVTLTSAFQNTTTDGLIVKDKLVTVITFDAYTPSTLSQLLDGLDKFKNKVSCRCSDDYAKAVALYEQIVAQGSAGKTVGLQEYVIQLENMLAGFSLNRVHTNAIIPTYVFTTNTISSSINLPNGTTSWILPYDINLLTTILVIAPTTTSITIGTTLGGTELLEVTNIVANGFATATVNRPFAIGVTLYFGGSLSDTQITIFKG